MSTEGLDGIAIVAVHGRFPGGATVEAFWENLVAGRETITFFSDAELVAAGLDPVELRRQGTYVPARGVLAEADCFDASFFGVHPKEAEVMDPQHRVFLEACWEVLERAGHDPARFPGPIGVYAGATFNTYYLSTLHPRPELRELVGAEQVMLGNEKDYLATRVAYKLDLKGPAISLNTACSSSLVAVCQACQALVTYQCDLALAGGVSVQWPQQQGYFFQEGYIASPDGHTRSFDAAAQGTAFSNGVTVVALRRLEDAVRDGDHIHAVIKGWAVNNDGARRVSFGAPGVEGQAEVVTLAQELAGVDPESITCVEAHGTATPIGDPIEVAALTKSFRRGTDRKQFCALGSVKSNVGHLDAAAGTAGLIKTALALEHRVLPPSLHFASPNPKLDLPNSPFYVNASLRPWETADGIPRRAGVSSFGTGGTNAHVVVEQAPEPGPESPARSSQLFVLSAKTADALAATSERLAARLRTEPALNLADVAFTLQTGRGEFSHRRILACQDLAEAIQLLVKPDAKRSLTSHCERRNVPVIFMFPGQGAQYLNMGAGLYLEEPVFRETLDECAEILKPVLGCDLREVLFSGTDAQEAAEERLRQTRFTQPALFAVEYALARLWMSWGVQPSAMIGHSVGEYVAGCLAGVFSLETALNLVARRAALVQAQPTGSMLAVRLPDAELAPLLPPDLAVAALNSPSLSVVSGPSLSVAAFEKALSDRGLAARQLQTSHAFHSAMMEPVVAPFAELLRQTPLAPPTIPYVSNVTARWITPEEATSPEYWAAHVRQTVRFTDGMGTLLRGDPCILLEVGPGQTLAQMARQHPGLDGKTPVVASLGTGRDQEVAQLTLALGRLWAAGAAVDWQGYHAGRPRRRVVLPTYPFARTRFCPQTPVATAPSESAPSSTGAAVAVEHPRIATMPLEAPPVDTAARRERLVASLRALVEELSGTSVADFDPSLSLLELGLDSLLLTQAATLVQRKFGVPVSFRQLMEELGTVAALAEYLDAKLPPDSPRPAATAPAAQPAPAPAAMPGPTGGLEQLLHQQLETTRQMLALVQGGSVPVLSSGTTEAPRLTVAKPAAMAASTGGHGPFRPMDRGTTGGLTPDQHQWLDGLVTRYVKRTGGSKRLAEQNRAGLADPRSAAGFKQLWKEMVYPIYTARSDGARIWDVDGNEYIDFVMGFGASLFGHRPPFVIEAIEKQLALGFEIGPIQPIVGEAAALVREFTGMERVAFCNTGSEAVLAAMRLARTVSGRDRIVTFSGDYHGIFDEVLYRPFSVNGEPGAAPIAPGIPRSAMNQLVALDYGSPEALEWIRAHTGELAAVMVEPVQSRRLDLQPREFLHEVRRITEQAGVALIFDEVVTGFRVHPGGAQAHFGVRADLATYGKVVGGGFPVGVVTGSARYMDALDGGKWQFGDESFPEVGVTFFAGTFVRHPITVAVAKAVLEHLKREGPALQERVARRTERAAAEVRSVLERHHAPYHLAHFSSLMYLTAEPEARHGGLLFYLLRERGIHIFENRAFVFTTAHTDADVEALVRALDDSLAELVRIGLVAAPDAGVSPLVSASSAGRHVAASDEANGLALTEPQRELWLGAVMDEGLARAFNVSFVLQCTGPLDGDRLERALQAVYDRHDAFRTSFDRRQPVQRIGLPKPVPLPRRDLSALDPAQRDEELRRIIDEQTNLSMDITHPPLLRQQLVRTGPEVHQLILTVSHLIADGWSVGVVLHELQALFSAAGGAVAPLEPALQFSSYVLHCAGESHRAAVRRAEEYWRGVFKTLPRPLDLPTDFPRPTQRSFRGDRVTADWDGEFLQTLKRAAARQGTTLQNYLLAGFGVLLFRLSQNDDLVVGIPAAGQIAPGMQEIPGSRALIGHCVNTLPVRLRCPGEADFATVLKELKRRMLDAYENQDLTFGSLLQSLNLPRDPSRPVLVPIVFNLDRAGGDLRLDAARSELTEVTRKWLAFDLSINIVFNAAGLGINWDYNTDIFAEVTMRRWLEHYRAILAAAAQEPQKPVASLPLAGDQVQRLLSDWNATQLAYPQDRCVHELVRAQADRTPESVAVVCGPHQLTYRQLWQRSAQLGQALRARAVGAGTLVGVYVERSIEMVVAVLGVLEAGGAYVPLDPMLPRQRLGWMIEDAAMPVIVTQSSLASTLPPHQATLVCLDQPNLQSSSRAAPKHPSEGGRAAPEPLGEGGSSSSSSSSDPKPGTRNSEPETRKPHSSDLAYVIFTSGSTGRPKGVQIEHRALVNLLHSICVEPGFSSSDTMLAVTTLSFDIAAAELFLPLTTGGRLVVADRDTVTDGQLLRSLLDSSKATFLQPTPVTWRLLLAAGWRGSPSLKMISTGEPLPPDLAVKLLAVGADLWNLYGPTETTIWSTAGRVAAGEGPVSIGRPIGNTQIHIVNEALQLQPVGVPGELLIGGDGLARGYLNRPKLTAEKFIPNPFGPGRLYRTGDLAKWQPDGTLVCLGRLDHQVKIRGFRIECGEIESVLASHPTIQQAAVLAREDAAGEHRLVAYLVPQSPGAIEAAALRDFLRQSLPDYMLPTAYVTLSALPLTANGKLDRQALPSPDWDKATPTAATYTAPRTDVESSLVAIWEEVLQRKPVGIDDDFFELGGHSLQAVQLQARIRDQFGVDVPFRDFFRNGSVISFAKLISSGRGSANGISGQSESAHLEIGEL